MPQTAQPLVVVEQGLLIVIVVLLLHILAVAVVAQVLAAQLVLVEVGAVVQVLLALPRLQREQ